MWHLRNNWCNIVINKFRAIIIKSNYQLLLFTTLHRLDHAFKYIDRDLQIAKFHHNYAEPRKNHTNRTGHHRDRFTTTGATALIFQLDNANYTRRRRSLRRCGNRLKWSVWKTSERSSSSSMVLLRHAQKRPEVSKIPRFTQIGENRLVHIIFLFIFFFVVFPSICTNAPFRADLFKSSSQKINVVFRLTVNRVCVFWKSDFFNNELMFQYAWYKFAHSSLTNDLTYSN